MANSPDLMLQKAMFAAIASTLAPVTVLAHPRHQEAFPYVFIGESEVSDTHPTGHEVLIVVHTWSKTEGPHEAKTIQQSIREELHANSLVEGGWQFVCIREDFASTFLDVDNETWHGVQRFRAKASPN